jgi:hypothetical protein
MATKDPARPDLRIYKAHKPFCRDDHLPSLECRAPTSDEIIAQVSEIVEAYLNSHTGDSNLVVAQIAAAVFNPLQRALLFRAANTEINLLHRLYGYTTATGSVIFGADTSWDNQVYALRAAIEILDA